MPGQHDYDFFSYHSSDFHNKIFGKQNLFFAVISGGLPFSTLTQALSHELVEAFTDRTRGHGWFSDDIVWWPFWDEGRELSDICNWGNGCPNLSLNGFTIASYWRQSLGMCMQQTDLTPAEQEVPDVVGDDPRTAQQTLSGASLVMTVAQTTPTIGVNSPIVSFQAPAAGALVPLNSIVTVTVETPAMSIVPPLLHQDLPTALRLLSEAKLLINITGTVYSYRADTTTVIQQNPQAETGLSEKSCV